jgi:diketogulonate reductase-like aldo/keto reductase
MQASPWLTPPSLWIGPLRTDFGAALQAESTQTLVATKFLPFPWRLRQGDLERALRRSLDRLGLERVDLYQIHGPFPPRSIETWVEALAEVKRKGLTRAIGVSNFDQNQTQRAYSSAKYDILLAATRWNITRSTAGLREWVAGPLPELGIA